MPTRSHQPCREEAAPTIYPAPRTKQPLPWSSTISPGSVTSVSIPSCSSLSTSPSPEPFFTLDSLSTWPLILPPSPPSPLYVRAYPPPLTPSSAPPPSGCKLSLNQGDSMALTLGTMCHRSSPHCPWRPAITALSVQAILYQPGLVARDNKTMELLRLDILRVPARTSSPLPT